MAETEDAKSKPTYLPPFPEIEKPEIDPTLLKSIIAHISWSKAQSGLGKMLLEFQLLETTIKEAIAFLINDKDLTVGRITTARMKFFQLLNVLCALFAHRFKDEAKVKSLREILEKCNECSTRRNELVHSFWYSDKDEGIAVRFEIHVGRGTQPYKESEEVVPEVRLELDATTCKLARAELQLIMQETFHEYRPPELSGPTDQR
jgi:hypothetical protein